MIHLVTDSTAYLPPEIKAQYNIHTISLKIIVGGQTFDEDGGITKDEFYRLLAKVDTTPTTSQPSAGEFEALYRQHVRRVYALCLRLSGNVALAEDLTQEAFVRAWRKLDQFRGESAFSTWLHPLAVNVAPLLKVTISLKSFPTFWRLRMMPSPN